MNAVVDQLERSLLELDISLPTAVAGRLIAYLELIGKWNRVYNLTAIREADKALTHHVLDCLAVLPHLVGGRTADVGSGAGLPGIPLALARPDWRVTLIESNHKKSTFLAQAIAELAIANAVVTGERVEAVEPAGGFDLVISRAFSDLPEFARLAGRLVAPAGTLAAMKGLYPDEELALLPPEWRVESVMPLTVPGIQAARHLVLMKRA
ncbi:MAG: 16S rRNA (guanine(527)-N(7))-methyltransferase RsmG [Burkholderiales bacterium]|nr:16S rRNA (guanine(527)-N(7))-methyltransferase RsmG [Burkholderiales bacterium]